MSQHDFNLGNATGASFRADANLALGAIAGNNSGATAPATTFAYQWWADTTTGLLKIRNAANSAWVTVGTLADATLGLLDRTVIDAAGDLIIGTAADTAGRLAIGTARQILQVNSGATAPAWVDSGVFRSVQIFTTPGANTYTAPAGLVRAVVELVAAGGGSGAVAALSAGNNASGGSGAGGGYAMRSLTSAQIGASQTATVGAAGTAGTTGGAAGGTGGTTSFGALLSATGGAGGAHGTENSSTFLTGGVSGGAGSSGDINSVGESSEQVIVVLGFTRSGKAGGSRFGFGGRGAVTITGPNVVQGVAGTGYGSGASGTVAYSGGSTTAATAGTAGQPGIIIVYEYF